MDGAISTTLMTKFCSCSSSYYLASIAFRLRANTPYLIHKKAQIIEFALLLRTFSNACISRRLIFIRRLTFFTYLSMSSHFRLLPRHSILSQACSSDLRVCSSIRRKPIALHILGRVLHASVIVSAAVSSNGKHDIFGKRSSMRFTMREYNLLR